ncbi:histidine phosphatase family protein [Bacillus cereus group sp. BfR-BA-01400]|uniref:histidine phosphatase family protein n=1 Tax=unclassified Bacillus cereus group TaxID=2750818 RepID=UPI001F57BEBD
MLDNYLGLNYTDIYLIRHADFNDKHLTGGWTDSTISKIGEYQSLALANDLENNLEINSIITSTLKRASMTAEIIADHLNSPLHYEDDFRTINNGILIGKTQEEAERLNINKYLEDNQYCIDQGESYQYFQNRIKNAFDKLVRTYKDKTILVVTHGRVIQTILKQLLQQHYDIKINYGVYPTGVTNIRIYEDNSILISKLNDTKHLSPNLIVSDVE